MTLARRKINLRAASASLFLGLLMLSACEPQYETGPPVPYTGPAADVLYKYLENMKNRPAGGYKMEVRFDGELPDMKKQGTLVASRIVTADGQVHYSVTSFEGDNTVKKDVIFRFMTAEAKARHDDGDVLSISPNNYVFKYKGVTAVDGVQAEMFQVTPRRKNPGLFKGVILIDASTYLPLREVGRFIASPSVFLKRIEFVRDYTVVNGIAFASFLMSRIDTRVWGPAILQVKYLSIKPLKEGEQPPTTSTGFKSKHAATAGKRSRPKGSTD